MSSTPDWKDDFAPSIDALAALAEAALAELPEAFRKLVGEVEMRVMDFAEDEVLDELEIEDPFQLTGLYQGPDLAHRSLLDPIPRPSMLFLYRRPILDEWCERGDVTLGELVTHVLVHEIGHHFGLSDADIERIEAG
jgi:predicted Zn-dependent protease with MMP-like domain